MLELLLSDIPGSVYIAALVASPDKGGTVEGLIVINR